jgi:N6-L-threonylcarbamoyladenine synthase
MTKILAIETSCDETAAAVIEDGLHIRSNVVASQIDIHRRYGGIFPEVASRQHILAISTVIEDAMTQARLSWNDLDALAVTYGPGLAGSLLVGVNTAKGLALGLDLPLMASTTWKDTCTQTGSKSMASGYHRAFLASV